MSLSKLLGKIDTPQQKKKPEVVVPLVREVEKEIPKDKRIVIYAQPLRTLICSYMR